MSEEENGRAEGVTDGLTGVSSARRIGIALSFSGVAYVVLKKWRRRENIAFSA